MVFLRCSARFLWKRIPQNVKSSNVELDKIYTVFNHLWHNNISGFFKAINHEWSNNVAELMFELKGKIRINIIMFHKTEIKSNITNSIFRKNIQSNY